MASPVWGRADMKSPVWGNVDFNISQAYGVNLDNVPDSWYAYVEEWGLPYGTHGGLDIAMPNGTKLYAPLAGKVVFGGENLDVFRPGYVELEYKIGDNTERFIFAHMNSTAVKTGDTVVAGQFIGTSGEQTSRGTRTPDGSGPHLHAERRDVTRQRLLDPTIILTGSHAVPHGGSGNWPTPEKINEWIQNAGNKQSPLRGMGDDFMRFGEKYGINPGIVVAIMQRESQMGADGSHLPTVFNNYAGITAAAGSGVFYLDREWAVFHSPKAGLEGVFKLLNTDLYRDTGGKLSDIMEKYSPAFENDWGAMFNTFRIVGDALGITINKDTNIYAGDDGSTGGTGTMSIDGLLSFIGASGPVLGVGSIGVVVLLIGVVIVFGRYTPVGRAIKRATK